MGREVDRGTAPILGRLVVLVEGWDLRWRRSGGLCDVSPALTLYELVTCFHVIAAQANHQPYIVSNPSSCFRSVAFSILPGITQAF